MSFNDWLQAKENRKRKPWVVREYRETHPCCELCGSTDLFGTPSGGVHHIKFKSQGGADCPTNLIFLCGRCHELAHKYDTEIELAIKRVKGVTIRKRRER